MKNIVFMKTKYTFLIILTIILELFILSSKYSYAEGNINYQMMHILPVTTRVYQAIASCSYQKFKCTILTGDTPNALTPDSFSTTAMKFQDWIDENSYDAISNFCDNLFFRKNIIKDKANAARKAIENSIIDIQNSIKEYDQSKCETFCRLSCITNKLIKFDKLDEFQIGGIHDIGPYHSIVKGRGVCRNFSAITEEIANQLGLQVSAEASNLEGRHSFISFIDIDNKKYVLDPQRDPNKTNNSCIAFPI